jgi:hypothetical protein
MCGKEGGLNTLPILIILEADIFLSASLVSDVKGILLARNRVLKERKHCTMLRTPLP